MLIKCVECEKYFEIYKVNLFSKRKLLNIHEQLIFEPPFSVQMLESLFIVYCNICFFEKE